MQLCGVVQGVRAIPCPILVEELRELYEVRKLTDQQIVDRLGTGATIKRVRSWRHRHGIETINRTERHDVPSIEGRLRSLLIGSMLGDGRLAHRVHATNYAENHCAVQRDYAEWKRQEWGAWVRNDLKPVIWKKNGKEFPGVRFHTVAHRLLNEWQSMFYPVKGPKRFPCEVVTQVDPLALAVWYMDDGCADWWPLITVCDESSQIGNQVLDHLGLKARWRNDTSSTGRLIIEGEVNAHRFIELVRPHIPECMDYKLDFGFQGPHYQVRQVAPEERLRELASKGVPIREIARRLGIGASTVDRYLRGHGIEHSRRIGRPLDTY